MQKGGKAMLTMPIVTLRRMAMNESVATTCCFTQEVNPTSISVKTLFGGRIDTEQRSVTGWDPRVPDAWKQLPYDVELSAYADLPAFPTLLIVNGQKWVRLTAEDGSLSDVTLMHFLFSENAKASALNRGCKHDGAACAYYTQLLIPESKHIGSTGAHDTAPKDWAAAHSASQFNS